MNKQTWKSIGAVFAGLLGVVITTTFVDIVLHVLHVYPPMPDPQAGTPVTPLTDGLALLASSYRVVITVAGGYLTAKLSPGRSLRDALVLGLVGTGLGILGAVQTWNLNMGPHWYAVSLAVLAIPECWFGGWLWLRRHPAPAPVAPPAG